MNILDLIMNKPITSLTAKDLQRIYKAGYIQVGELVDLKNIDPNASYDIALFFLRFPNKYNVGMLEMEYINYVYGATNFVSDLDAIRDARSLIVKGLQKLAGDKQMCMNELITKLQRDCE